MGCAGVYRIKWALVSKISSNYRNAANGVCLLLLYQCHRSLLSYTEAYVLSRCVCTEYTYTLVYTELCLGFSKVGPIGPLPWVKGANCLLGRANFTMLTNWNSIYLVSLWYPWFINLFFIHLSDCNWDIDNNDNNSNNDNNIIWLLFPFATGYRSVIWYVKNTWSIWLPGVPKERFVHDHLKRWLSPSMKLEVVKCNQARHFHQHWRYCHKSSTIVFSIPSAVTCT